MIRCQNQFSIEDLGPRVEVETKAWLLSLNFVDPDDDEDIRWYLAFV